MKCFFSNQSLIPITIGFEISLFISPHISHTKQSKERDNLVTNKEADNLVTLIVINKDSICAEHLFIVKIFTIISNRQKIVVCLCRRCCRKSVKRLTEGWPLMSSGVYWYSPGGSLMIILKEQSPSFAAILSAAAQILSVSPTNAMTSGWLAWIVPLKQEFAKTLIGSSMICGHC